MKNIIAAAAATMAMAANAQHFIDGNSLLGYIQSSEAVQRTMAMGFVSGVVDTMQNDLVCVPPTVSIGQVTDLAKAHIIASPAERHQAAAFLVLRSVRNVWPCKAKTPAPSGAGVL